MLCIRLGGGVGLIHCHHTSHVLQPLEIVCFKLFKLAFRSYKNVWTLVHKREGVGFKRRPSTMDIFSYEKNIEFTKHHERLQDDEHLTF